MDKNLFELLVYGFSLYGGKSRDLLESDVLRDITEVLEKEV